MTSQPPAKKEKSNAAPQKRRRTGGRSAIVKSKVMESALVELNDHGYSHFNVGRIAERAGVHESTIYRRWPTREGLIIDACLHFADRQLPIPDTGDLRTDLRIALGNVAAAATSPIGQSLAFIGISARSTAEFAEVGPAFWRTRIDISQQIFDRAVSRGDWPAGYDKEMLFGELIGPILTHYFLLGNEIDADFIEARVDVILALNGKI